MIPIAVGPFEGLQRNFFWAGRHLCYRVVLLLEDLVKDSRRLGMGGWEITVLELVGFFGQWVTGRPRIFCCVVVLYILLHRTVRSTEDARICV